MEEKISLARKEESRRSVLLAGSGDGTPGKAGSRGVQGQKGNSDAKGAERATPGHSAKKGKGDAEDKGGNGRGRRRGRHYSLRGEVRDIEGVNRPSGRSAKELGINWLDGRCDDSPSKAHWLMGTTVVDGGTMYKCKFCHKVTWLPDSLEECMRLSNWVRIYGLDGGFQRILNFHPQAKRLLSKIQDLYYLKKSIPANMFPLAVAAVMLDREYPYDVEIQEEEIL